MLVKAVSKSSLALKSATLAMLCLAAPLLMADGPQAMRTGNSSPALKIGVVNFKTAIENSKAGKLEQANFDALKKQMEVVLKEKESKISEIAAKFNDPDYLDSLSAEAENELKHKFRVMSQELSQIQNEYYQTLNQANMKILQDLNDVVAEASSQVAKKGNYDVILNDESCFFSNSAIDVTGEVTNLMDQNTEKKKSS